MEPCWRVGEWGGEGGGWTEGRRGREGRLLRVSDFEGSDGCRPNKKKKKRKKMKKKRERGRGETEREMAVKQRRKRSDGWSK